MKWLWLLCFILPSVSALDISEVMYNPPGNDNNLEYVEIYSEEEINLSLYTFEDASASDSLALLQQMDSAYYLIVENGFNFSGVNASVYTTGPTLGDNLNNDHDVILLRKDGEIIASVQYDSSMGGNGNNMSLCFNITFYECVPTPGFENVKPFVNTSILDNTMNVTNFVDYSGLRLSEVLPNPSGLDSEMMPDGEWVELFNSGQTLDVFGLELCDLDWHCFSLDHDHFLSGTVVTMNSYVVAYVSGQSLFNNAGKEGVRLVHEGIVLDKMEYDSSIEDTSWSYVDQEWILTKPTPGQANAPSQEQETKLGFSTIDIQKIFLGKDNLTRFGETVDVKLHIYKGETKKDLVHVSVENLTAEIKFSLFEHYQTTDITLPLQLPDNCDGKHAFGWYTLLVDGLDIVVRQRFLINGTEGCTSSFTSTILPQHQLKESIINETSWQSPEEEIQQAYTSQENRIARYGIYGFIIAAVLLVGYFLIER